MNLDPARLPAVLEWNEVIARFLMLCQHELQQLDRPLGSLDRVFQVSGAGEMGGGKVGGRGGGGRGRGKVAAVGPASRLIGPSVPGNRGGTQRRGGGREGGEGYRRRWGGREGTNPRLG